MSPPVVGPTHQLVPGPAVPPGVRALAANNNLDGVRHHGELLLAWRTAPTHFASADAALHVVATTGAPERGPWRHELTVAMGRDVREPRLVSWGERLLLYWFTAGVRATGFEPDRVWVSERSAAGRWSEPEPVSPPDTVVWRVRPVGEQLLMSVYRGAASLFTAEPRPLEVGLWASPDGRTWGPHDPARPVVHRGGSEAEWLVLGDGRLVAVVRKEGPDGGWGSDICVAPAGGLSRWASRPHPRKLDSPCLLEAAGRLWLVARRSTAAGGRYDVAPPWLGGTARTRVDQVAWWLTPKRAAIYDVDPEALTATWAADLPSAGDTAFAAAVPAAAGGGERQLLLNYTSPLRPAWRPWVAGQLRPTRITATEVDLSA